MHPDSGRPPKILLCAITNRRPFAGDAGAGLEAVDAAARARVIEQARLWAANGVDVIQLREKDMSGSALVELAKAMRAEIMRCGRTTRLLINSRPDVAIAAEADGVHLPSGTDALIPDEVRTIFAAAGRPRPYISVACHTLSEVAFARAAGVDLIVFAPVFGKDDASGKILPGVGLEALREVCLAAAPVPVVALGGVTATNAADCLKAGAAGIAAIRLFHQAPSIWRELARSTE